ncbi:MULTISPECIES: glycosyltransferase family 2 protein [Acinetobacter]|uniref:glycosyltransferase family 2 protein n=1 Tax=Acinetobacter TaxID=469 RepID=UPI0015D25FE0|nr:glycosyltransferase family 2 protein [Acinetobacter sp. YH01012]
MCKKLVSLTIVVPCFNEEEMLPISIPKFMGILKDLIKNELITESSKILFIDDGSKDKTWSIIQQFHQKDQCINGLKLSRNFGHQNALLSGLMSIDTDISISIDADLQDDPSVIKKMIEAYYEGAEIVFGVRDDRSSDSFSKRFFAQNYYKVMNKMGVDLIQDHADFRLMSKKALKVLGDFKEVNLFLRGIIPVIGFKTKKIYYARLAREAGETKYNIKKMLELAINGITSFSVVPLIFIIWIGIFISILSGLMGLWALIVKFFIGGTVEGWTSIVVPMYFLGGIQLFTLGIIGVYIAKVYMEVKARPRYIIEEILS